MATGYLIGFERGRKDLERGSRQRKRAQLSLERVCCHFIYTDSDVKKEMTVASLVYARHTKNTSNAAKCVGKGGNKCAHRCVCVYVLIGR